MFERKKIIPIQNIKVIILINFHLFQIKNVYLNPEMFSTVNNLATPTMKIKRLACRQVFKETILELYNEFDNIKRAKL